MKDKKLLVMALSLILCLTVSIGIAFAYFTDYEDARGGAVLKLSGRTEIEEKFDNNDKLLTVSNTSEDDIDMVVRATAFGENLEYSAETAGDWVDGGDGYWYYTKILSKGDSTSQLRVKVSGKVSDDDPLDLEVIVAHEASRVTYTHDADGNNFVKAPEGWDGFPSIPAAAE